MLAVSIILIIGSNLPSLGCDTFRLSSIESDPDATSQQLYALCTRGAQTGKSGVNARDCKAIERDVTTEGKLENYEKCIKIINSLQFKQHKQKKLDCLATVYGSAKQ